MVVPIKKLPACSWRKGSLLEDLLKTVSLEPAWCKWLCCIATLGRFHEMDSKSAIHILSWDG